MPAADRGNVTKVVIAVALLIAYVFLLSKMWALVGTEKEIQWARATYLLGGLESLVFAAVGFLFGQEVHRERAEQAEKRAGETEKKAKDAESKAEDAQRKGRDLANKVRSTAKAQGTVEPLGLAARPQLEDLVRLSDEYFP